MDATIGLALRYMLGVLIEDFVFCCLYVHWLPQCWDTLLMVAGDGWA
jgi:hypothetical protein